MARKSKTGSTGITRKEFLAGTIGLGTVATLNAALPSRPPKSPANNKKPNILFIVSDQERSGSYLPPDLSLPGHDKLLQRGVNFKNFVVTTTPCSPSRSVIYTGQHTKFTKITGNPGTPSWTDMSEDIPTIGDMLRDAGYYTAYKGKWHLSEIEVNAGAGFAPYPSTENALEPYGFSDYTITGDLLGEPWSGFRDDRVTASEAAHWLQNASTNLDKQPWFLAVNFVNPHDIMFYDAGGQQNETRIIKDLLRPIRPAPAGWPYDENLGYPLPESYYKSNPDTKTWAHRAFAQRNNDLYGRLAQGEDEEAWQRFQNYYFNCIRDMDQYLETVVSALEASGQLDNTIIVYTSDHGEMAGAQGLTQKGPVTYKENISAPFIVCHPDGPSGVDTDGLGTALDIAPTLLSFAGISDDTIQNRFPDLRGVNLAPHVMAPSTKTERDSRGSLVYFDIGIWTDPDIMRKLKKRRDDIARLGPDAASTPVKPSLDNPAFFRAIIHGQYKFARYFKPMEHHTPLDWQMLTAHNELELYDMKNDPHELNNLGRFPEQHKELILQLNQLLNAAIAAEIGVDDGSEFPGPPGRYLL